ncbi:MAG: DUF937 domain-containing protein [Burkholderiaceae bacterium]|nr:DUF937 domain-containing protein [Burkholderiaceae bacterium]
MTHRHRIPAMQLTELLSRTGGLESIARELGLDESQATSGAQALLPAILGGLQKQAQSQPSAGAGLGALLGRLGGGNLLDDVVSPQPTDPSRGNHILGQIFGSKDVSRSVAQNASSQSGLDPSLLRRMLPMLAMLVAGYLPKQGGASAGNASTSTGDAGLLSSLGDGLASRFDADGNGNPLDDILRSMRK